MPTLDRPAYRRAAWTGVLLIGVGLIVEALEGDVRGTAIFAAFGGAAAVFMIWDELLPSLFDLLFVIAALVSGVGWTWDMAHRFPPYDQINHFFTIFAITLSLGYLIYHSVRAQFSAHRRLLVLAIASFGMSVGALWEIFEWLIGAVGPPRDIILDLVMDGLGAAVAGLVAAWGATNQAPERRPTAPQASERVAGG